MNKQKIKEQTQALENNFPFRRAAGVLLHPTSLPSDLGIGSIGTEAIKFLDFLKDYDLHIWQILPLGHPGYGESPYFCLSSFAGNPMIIDLEGLIDIGLLNEGEIEKNKPDFPKQHVDFAQVIPYKIEKLKLAFQSFETDASNDLISEFNEFKQEHKDWLKDYALFLSIKKVAGMEKTWQEWDSKYRKHTKQALKSWEKKHKNEIQYYNFIQFLFYRQWSFLKKNANKKGIWIFGDIPIYVAPDSADVWGNQDIFNFDYVAGVPPDLFSPETGQRWGNPIYRWDKLKEQDYDWWVKRIEHELTRVDILRIDHFRGFEAYWSIPVEEKTAVKGEWIEGPGSNIFRAIKDELGDLPIIAENLGVITPPVEKIRREFNFPGMKLLLFAFDNSEKFNAQNKHLPHWHEQRTCCYLGTHDNQTALGWWKTNLKQNNYVPTHVLNYINLVHQNEELVDPKEISNKVIVSKLIETIWRSSANIAIVTMQDILRLGNEDRMNMPSTDRGNWEFQFTWDQYEEWMGKELKSLNKKYARDITAEGNHS